MHSYMLGFFMDLTPQYAKTTSNPVEERHCLVRNSRIAGIVEDGS